MMITNQRNGHVEALRAEFKAQKREPDGIVNYHVWLEEKLIESQRDEVRATMAARANFDKWRETENELIRTRSGLDYMRGWCKERGYSLVLRVIEAHCD